MGLALNIFCSFMFYKVNAHFAPYMEWEEDFLSEMSQWLILFQLQICLLFSTGVVDPYGPMGDIFVSITASLVFAVFGTIVATMRNTIEVAMERWWFDILHFPEIFSHFIGKPGLFSFFKVEAPVVPLVDVEFTEVEAIGVEEAKNDYDDASETSVQSPPKIFTARSQAWTNNSDPLPPVLDMPEGYSHDNILAILENKKKLTSKLVSMTTPQKEESDTGGEAPKTKTSPEKWM
jgi:hypothetical protein